MSTDPTVTQVVMVFEKETPGTRRYKEVAADTDKPILRTLYVTKPAALKLGDTIVVSVRDWDAETDA